MIHWLVVAVILIAGVVTAALIVFTVFYLVQMRSSDRILIRELHEYIQENRAAIAALQQRNRLCDDTTPDHDK